MLDTRNGRQLRPVGDHLVCRIKAGAREPGLSWSMTMRRLQRIGYRDLTTWAINTG